MANVTTSTVNMTGFFTITRGSSFTNEFFKLSFTCSFGNKEAEFLSFITEFHFNELHKRIEHNRDQKSIVICIIFVQNIFI